jgi:hypothetical protein
MTYFEDLIKAMNNWEEEIFNYFISPITNAYTESLNRLIKTMNHVGRGYSFEALRAKILFTQGYRKEKKEKLARFHPFDLESLEELSQPLPGEETERQTKKNSNYETR